MTEGGTNIVGHGVAPRRERTRRDAEEARRDRRRIDPDENGDDLAERIEAFEEAIEANLATRRSLNRRIGRWSHPL